MAGKCLRGNREINFGCFVISFQRSAWRSERASLLRSVVGVGCQSMREREESCRWGSGRVVGSSVDRRRDEKRNELIRFCFSLLTSTISVVISTR
jgi:hypothetical protein